MEKWCCHILIVTTTAKLIVQTCWGSLRAIVVRTNSTHFCASSHERSAAQCAYYY